MAFTWKGQTLTTYGEILGAATTLASVDEGQEFMKAYRATNPHADSNIGYLTGYLDAESARRVLLLTKTQHPIFGVEHAVNPEHVKTIVPRVLKKVAQQSRKARRGKGN